MFNQPNATNVDAAINAPEYVELFDLAGKAMRVQAADEAYWTAQGFTRFSGDPAGAASELFALLGAASEAIRAYVDGVLADGVIDTSDVAAQRTAEVAMQEVERAWDKVRRVIGARYAVKQGAPVRMWEGTIEHRVDPGQVEEYQLKGWTTGGAR